MQHTWIRFQIISEYNGYKIKKFIIKGKIPSNFNNWLALGNRDCRPIDQCLPPQTVNDIGMCGDNPKSDLIINNLSMWNVKQFVNEIVIIEMKPYI